MVDADAVVFDLDGTLVRLVVDWPRVAEDVAAVLADRGVDPPDDLWGMLEAADATGNREAVEATIARHERAGARRSERLPAADHLPAGPVAVCSLNCEAACRIALETHGLADAVDVVVGRDTVPAEKPDPAPLLTAIRRLDATPAGTVFVGDSDRDAQTARAADVQYLDVDEWLRRQP